MVHNAFYVNSVRFWTSSVNEDCVLSESNFSLGGWDECTEKCKTVLNRRFLHLASLLEGFSVAKLSRFSSP